MYGFGEIAKSLTEKKNNFAPSKDMEIINTNQALTNWKTKMWDKKISEKEKWAYRFSHLRIKNPN